MHILITGGTGLLGKRLTSYLKRHGMFPRLVSRRAITSTEILQYEWNINEGRIDPKALAGLNAVIHLAGSNVAEARWSASRKEEILDSRVRSTRLLFERIKEINPAERPETFICASATGYYGIHDFEHTSVEDDGPGNDFLAQVCIQWEKEADRFESLGMRVVKVRTGVVLDQDGGALQKMTQPIKFFAGSPLGSGNQYISWIHWQDWCQAIRYLMTRVDLSGAYNFVSPHAVTNEELTRLIARTIRRPLWLPNVPEFMLKIILGEMASIVLAGHKVSSKKLEDVGYQFKFQMAEEAIAHLLGPH